MRKGEGILVREEEYHDQGTDEGSQEGCFPKQGEQFSQEQHLEQDARTGGHAGGTM